MGATDDDPSYAFPAWTLLYVVVMALSLAASFTAALALHKYSKLVSSCICYAMLHFFTWKSIYSLFRITVLAVLMEQFNHKSSTWFILDRDHDIGGFRLVGHENADHLGDVGPPPFYVKMALFIGDISLLSGSFWMFVLVAELLRLVKTTVDRGVHAERKIARAYMVLNLILMLAYFAGVTSSTLPSTHSFYSNRFRLFLVTSTASQCAVVLFVSGAVLYLNCTGQKLECVHCSIVQKPLYCRLKQILLVYDITALQYFAVGWIMTVKPATPHGNFDYLPRGLVIVSNLLYFASPIALAFLLVANQQCMMSWCMVPEDVIQQFQANEPPTDFPVFVNTDIESSSALWGALGSVMHDAQDIHDNLLRTLLVPHHGYEITTAGDSFQLAFHNIADAVAYCLDVQQKLLQQEWPRAFVDCHMPGSATITTHQSLLKRPKMVFHGVRVRMGIHASNPAEGDLVNQVHPVTGRMMYVGLSELIGREVSDIGCGGQIIITAPIVRWLRINLAQRTEWAKAHSCLYYDMGVHRIQDLKIDLGIAQVVPLSLHERVGMFPPRSSTVRFDSPRCPETSHYSLLISPHQPQYPSYPPSAFFRSPCDQGNISLMA
ncbi:hypothetical protein H257_05299 [Aphanomyces astaci]|uniref:Guanylate cyclase domain-containing protein n=2 Tax=Aphanomyces astaci TaxID=112090 RepID=W4GPN7_APHAT|nr:hypothetical protein H257_05299 [Aphanomyces astaci]ETV81690.1 hypothetical protein H257_05299 [Aphanomyces astaci]|eukprot:XP_009828427.1 hypothetical protein H257_05299 [Aphanomyces astaci]